MSHESQKTNTDPVGFSLSYFHTVSVSFIAHSRMCGFLFGIPEIIDHLYRK